MGAPSDDAPTVRRLMFCHRLPKVSGIGMRWNRDRVVARVARAATALILGTVAFLAVAWAAPRTSEAVGTWIKSPPAVTTRTVAIEPRLQVGQAGPENASSAERLRSAREAGPVTLDVGKGFTMVGLMCDVPATGAEVEVQLRTSLDGREWSAWYAVPLEIAGDGDKAPRAFTDALWTGEGRFVQVCAAAVGDDAPLALSGVELMALDTEGGSGVVAAAATTLRQVVATISGVSLAAPAAAAVETPLWVTRAGWGADESLRTGEPAYATVKMAFVHHTAGSNSYTEAQAPSIVRGIYAYHTLGLGWSDIGYNFLIDRYGTTYVGRYGGPRQGVIGAQAYGFNTGSTGVSVMGTYTSEAPPAAAMNALGRLLAWKLEVHGLDPLANARMTCGATEKYTEGQTVTLPVISGHRDANYTACPGDALYAKLGAVRSAAATQIKLASVVPEPFIVTLGLSATEVAVDTKVTYKGTVKTASGAPAVGTVTIQKRLAPDGDWINWRSATLSSTGAYSVAVTMTSAPRDWQFRARMPGDGAVNLTGKSPIRELQVVIPEPYVVTLSLSATEVAVGTTVAYRGTVKTASGAAAAGTVTVQKRLAPDGDWINWRSATLSSTGAYSVAVTMTSASRDWQFRARMPGDGAVNLTGKSPIRELQVVIPEPYVVTLSLSATEVAVGTTVAYRGTVKTASGAAAAGTVTVQKRLAPDGDWANWRSATLSSTGAYSVAVTMTTASRSWQFRTRMVGDGVNLTAFSPIRGLIVR